MTLFSDDLKLMNLLVQKLAGDTRINAIQWGRGEHLTLPSHTTYHADPQWAVHEDAQTTLMASGISLDFHPKIMGCLPLFWELNEGMGLLNTFFRGKCQNSY